MHAALKFFDFPFTGTGGQGANKIGIKLPDQAPDEFCGNENGFMEIMAALTRIPPQELNTSLAQLDWIPVEDNGGELAPLIDLTDQGGRKNSILQMLLPKQGTDSQTPQVPLQTTAELQESNPTPGKNAGILEMIQPPTEQQIKQAPSVGKLPLPNVLHHQAQEDIQRAVPTLVTPSNRTAETELVQETSRNAIWMNAGESNNIDDETTSLQQHKGARLVLTDRAAETAMQKAEKTTVQANKEPLPSEPQPLRSNALENLLAKEAHASDKRLSVRPLVRQPVSENTNSTGQTTQLEGTERTISQERSQQINRFVSMVSDRQTVFAQKASGESIAVAQEAGLQISDKTKQQQFNQSVRIDASPAMREEVFAVKSSEGAEMQLNSNSTREGAPSFDSQLSTTAPKTVESSASVKETMPFVEKDTQTDVIRQIVQRMTLKTDRQQSQMVIRLKPDFLGNVRLQVTTEGQQVIVRMDAESVMVKDIVEQNMAHLKAELHQHGLEIEKFDVFVGNENDGWRSGQQQSGFRQASKRGDQQSNGAQTDDESFDHKDDSDDQSQTAKSYSNNEVDYFV